MGYSTEGQTDVRDWHGQEAVQAPIAWRHERAQGVITAVGIGSNKESYERAAFLALAITAAARNLNMSTEHFDLLVSAARVAPHLSPSQSENRLWTKGMDGVHTPLMMQQPESATVKLQPFIFES